MLPLLKKYSDEIRAAHLDVIETSSKSLKDDMDRVEHFYCSKLLGALEKIQASAALRALSVGSAAGPEVNPTATVTTFTSDSEAANAAATATATAAATAAANATATAAATATANVTTFISDSEAAAAATAAVRRGHIGVLNNLAYGKCMPDGTNYPSLRYLKDLDTFDCTILDEFIAEDEKQSKLHGGGFAYYSFLQGDADHTAWVVDRGFYTGYLRANTYIHNITILEALLKRGVTFRYGTPLILAEEKHFEALKWLYENVDQDWGCSRNEVLEAVVDTGDLDIIKLICRMP